LMAIPLVNALEVVEQPQVVCYPAAVSPHVGIVNVRGTVVPVVSLGPAAEEASHLIVLESPNHHPFALLALTVRPASLTDSAIASQCRSTDPLSGVVSIDGRPVRWGTVAWLAQTLFSEEPCG
jgi:chemotaxis signal transduction protein